MRSLLHCTELCGRISPAVWLCLNHCWQSVLGEIPSVDLSAIAAGA